MNNPKVWSTTDIALAAYVNMRGKTSGISLTKVERNGKDSKYFFKDRNDKIDELIVQFPASESFEFDSMVRVLKSLGHSKNIRNKGRNNNRP